jgi:hypothetical protein
LCPKEEGGREEGGREERREVCFERAGGEKKGWTGRREGGREGGR